MTNHPETLEYLRTARDQAEEEMIAAGLVVELRREDLEAAERFRADKRKTLAAIREQIARLEKTMVMQ
jgi:hypothetical protein